MTFRIRGDGLCPRCAYRAEDLIEQIELDALDRDLTLITEFDAYCRQRDERHARETSGPVLDAFGRERLFTDDVRRQGPFPQVSSNSTRRTV